MLVTLSDMKAYLGISGSTYDDFLTGQIGLMSDTIETYCRRIFSQTTYTETIYSSDYPLSNTLETFMFPLISVTSVTEDSILLASDQYRVHKPTGRIIRPDGYFNGGTSTVLVYSAGYATIPTPIQDAVYSLVAARYNKKVSGIALDFGSDVQRVSVPGVISVDFDYSLSNNERSTGFGSILGNQVNVIDYYRSDRKILPSGKLEYVV